MPAINYVATTNWESVNKVGLSILKSMIAADSRQKGRYLDLSNVWEAYFPRKRGESKHELLSLNTFKHTVRSWFGRCVFRLQLDRAGIRYASFGKAAVRKAIAQQSAKMNGHSYERLLCTEVFGCAVANILFHDAALFLKVHDFYSIEDGLKAEVRRMALVLLALNQLLFERQYIEAGERFFAQEGYSFNALIKLSARENGGELVFFTAASHKNISFDMVEFTPDTLPSRRRRKCKYWEEYSEQVQLKEHLLNESLLDIETRLLCGGSHIYSPPLIAEHFTHSPHSELRIKQHLPLVTVFTSSMDEFVATQSLQRAFSQELPAAPQVFTDQVDMLRSLATLATKQKNFCLVVRHHPRLGNTKGETRSQYYEELCSALDAFDSDYVRVLKPESPVSSYWLIAWSSCVLNAWSNIGLECLRLGVPALNMFSEHQSVCYWPQALFPRHDSLATIEGFIQRTIREPHPTDMDRDRFRLSHSFYSFMNVSTYINLAEQNALPEKHEPQNKELLHAVLEPRNWEKTSFAIATTVIDKSREFVSAELIANRLLELFKERGAAVQDAETECPLVRRLAHYASRVC